MSSIPQHSLALGGRPLSAISRHCRRTAGSFHALSKASSEGKVKKPAANLRSTPLGEL